MPPKVSKIEVELKKLSKLECNKVCADCPEKVPTYVDLTHNIFLCTKCAGIHRDFQFKVKGISMSVFSEDDIQNLAQGGNEKHNAKYLARWSSREYNAPSNTDTVKQKEFIKLKYIDKRWYNSSGSEGFGHSDSAASSDFGASFSSPSAPSGGFGKPAHSTSSSTAAAFDLLSVSEVAPTPAYDPFASSRATSAFDSHGPSHAADPFGSSGSTPAARHGSINIAPHDPFATSTPAARHGSINIAPHDPFAAPVTSAPAAHQPFDAFGSSVSQAQHPSADPFAAGPSHGASAATQSFGNFDNHSFGAFDSFGHAATKPAAGAPASNASSLMGLTMPMAAPAPAQPAAAPTAQPASKDFSVFDDIAAAPTPAANPASANPFDFTAPGSTHVHGQQPHGQQPHGQQPQAYPGAYPGAGPTPGAPAGYGQPASYPYPGVPYGQPAYGQPAYGQPAYGQPAYGQPAYGQAPYGQVPPQGYGYPGQGGQPVPPQPYGAPYGGAQAYPPMAPMPAPAPVPTTAPAPADPFAAMTTAAWSAAGRGSIGGPSGVPPPSTPGAAPGPAPASLSPNPMGFGGPAPAAAPKPAASVNPFDLF